MDSEILTMRLSSDLKQKLDIKAKAKELSLSAYVRLLMINDVKEN
jgi:predicted HicB family RNase H-like nuclease